MKKLSREVSMIYSRLWENGMQWVVQFEIGRTYTYKGKKYRTTEKTYEELLSLQEKSEKPFKIQRTGKVVNVTGMKSE